MSGYWPRPDDGLGTAPYHYQFPSDALGADVLDPTIPDGLDVHPDTHWDFESDLTQLLKAAAPDPVAPTVSSVPPLPAGAVPAGVRVCWCAASAGSGRRG